MSNVNLKNALIRKEFQDAATAQKADFDRAREAWNVVSAINGSQWEPRKLLELNEEGRHPWQFNVVAPKVETLAGSILSERPDANWMPVRGRPTTATEAIKFTYDVDKDLFNYENTLMQVIIDGCVHVGWFQIKESKKYDPSGNITVERLRPGYFIPSPYWVTDDVNDLHEAWKIAYLTADQMSRLYNKKTDEIRRAIRDQKENGKMKPPNVANMHDAQWKYDETIGNQYRVIERHWLNFVKKDRLIGSVMDLNTGTLKQVTFPLTEDRELLNKFAELNGVDWTNVNVTPYEDRIHMVDTITDLDLNITLSSGKSATQPNSLGFYYFTCQRFNGRNKGVAEDIIDTQRIINEKESYILDMLAKSGGGSNIYNKRLFEDPQQEQEFVKKNNKPGKTWLLDLDRVDNPRLEITPGTVSPEAYREIMRQYDNVLPMVSRVSDSMSAIQSSEESGVLFEKRVAANRLGHLVYNKRVKGMIKSFAEGYFYQWLHTYAGPEREVIKRDGTSVVLNKRVEVDGVTYIENPVASTPRTFVQVTESASSPNHLVETKLHLSDLMEKMQHSPAMMAALVKSYIRSTNMPKADKAEIEAAANIEFQNAISQSAAGIAQSQAVAANSAVEVAQAQQMLQQAGQPGQPQEPEVAREEAPAEPETPPVPAV